MIEQLSTNHKYLLLETTQDRSYHLSQLDTQKIDRNQTIFSSFNYSLFHL